MHSAAMEFRATPQIVPCTHLAFGHAQAKRQRGLFVRYIFSGSARSSGRAPRHRRKLAHLVQYARPLRSVELAHIGHQFGDELILR